MSLCIEPGASSDAIIQAIREHGEKGRRATRREMAHNKQRMLANSFGKLVADQVAAAMDPENFDDLAPYVHSTTNLLQSVAWESALNYVAPARRFVQPVEGADETPAKGEAEEAESLAPGQEALEAILRISAEDRDSLMGIIEQLTIAHEAVVVRPAIRDLKLEAETARDGTPVLDEDGQPRMLVASGRLYHDILTPDIVDVVCNPNDPTRPVGYYWTNQEEIGGKLVDVTHYWDATHFFKFDEHGAYVSPPVEHGFARRDGLPPLAVFRRGMPTRTFWIEGSGDDLFDATLEVCTLKTELNHAIKVGLYQQPVVSGEFDPAKRKQLLGNHNPIVLHSNDTLTMASFGPEGGIAQYDQSIREKEIDICRKYGISPDQYRMNAQPESGFARRVASAKQIRMARERRKYLVAGELELLECDRAVLEKYGLLDEGALPEDATIVIDPAEPEIEESWQEEEARTNWELDHGLISIVDLMKRRNPDLDDEEAERLLEQNRLVNRRLRPAAAAPPPGAPGGAGSPLSALLGRMGGAPPRKDDAPKGATP